MRVWPSALVVGIAVLGACSKTPLPECTVTELPSECLPQYVPTFDNVYTNTLAQNCGAADGACHSEGGESRLSFASKQAAYDQLIADRYVVAGDPACSEMIVRITDVGEDYAMPQGDPLAEAERCALQQWVRMGAPGPATP